MTRHNINNSPWLVITAFFLAALLCSAQAFSYSGTWNKKDRAVYKKINAKINKLEKKRRIKIAAIKAKHYPAEKEREALKRWNSKVNRKIQAYREKGNRYFRKRGLPEPWGRNPHKTVKKSVKTAKTSASPANATGNVQQDVQSGKQKAPVKTDAGHIESKTDTVLADNRNQSALVSKPASPRGSPESLAIPAERPGANTHLLPPAVKNENKLSIASSHAPTAQKTSPATQKPAVSSMLHASNAPAQVLPSRKVSKTDEEAHTTDKLSESLKQGASSPKSSAGMTAKASLAAAILCAVLVFAAWRKGSAPVRLGLGAAALGLCAFSLYSFTCSEDAVKQNAPVNSVSAATKGDSLSAPETMDGYLAENAELWHTLGVNMFAAAVAEDDRPMMEQAICLLEKAAASSDDPAVTVDLADAYMELGSPVMTAIAIDMYESLFDGFTDDPLLARIIAGYYQLGNYDASLALSSKRLEHCPDVMRRAAAMQMCFIALSSGKFAQAEAILTENMKVRGDDPVLRLFRAVLKQGQGEMAHARDELDVLISTPGVEPSVKRYAEKIRGSI